MVMGIDQSRHDDFAVKLETLSLVIPEISRLPYPTDHPILDQDRTLFQKGILFIKGQNRSVAKQQTILYLLSIFHTTCRLGIYILPHKHHPLINYWSSLTYDSNTVNSSLTGSVTGCRTKYLVTNPQGRCFS